MNTASNSELVALVERTVGALKGVTLPLDMPGANELNTTRRQLLAQLESRILPHLRETEVPTIVVLGGSSGAGKSTLFNSVLGEEASEAGVLRPTTRTPVIAIHPSDKRSMSRHGIGNYGKFVEVAGGIPGIALVDAPDLDSVDESNRELSARLMDSADLWVFVTTASRYGDAVAWSTLETARRRGITTAVVLDRVSERAFAPVREDLVSRMAQMDLADSPLFIIPDQGPHEGLLPANVVAEFRGWLETIAARKMGEALVDRTTAATLPHLRTDLTVLAEAVEMQSNAITDLKDKAREATSAPLEKLATNIEHGRFGRGAPTTSWLSLASTGGPLASLVAGRKPGLFAKRRGGERDNAMSAIFDAVLSSARVALVQGILAARGNVETAWREDIANLDELAKAASASVNPDEIADRTLAAWARDLRASGSKDNAWLSGVGVAALIGAAAGGVAGAQKAAAELGYGSQVEAARASLASHVREALDEVTSAYTGALDEISVGDARALRLRASELLDIEHMVERA
ncbi:energy-coupling factor transporter ATP-binding protein EcfA2 [Arcanobacterium wilhelmae]|uniref:Energy-coupling factor transporter ATP-binding protein EcfA2 n=1 Tax=Arcanobacterium wilhelmae TaxID=1803177 RepID=A0ABT9NA66_9ACTO|nr:GTPase domain-containing protein [Arcanobacterium wilhelmae]MDP9800385.1 energy-coupling factor transporter ATP-binding protein EcfA2 [Arcanobacterium wilhelmae]